jgi:hypothetical protein
VRVVRSLSLVVGLTAILTLSHISIGFAGSSDQKAQASYRTNASTPVNHASSGTTPPNCVREACGRLWCWNQGRTSSSH